MSTLPARIAVVHDWLIDLAGAERALSEILRCLPQADLFTLVDRMPAAERAQIGARTVQTSFLQRMPFAASHLGWYLPLWPVAIEQLDVTGYDLVISSSHAVAKGVLVSPDALHLSYVYSPMRYAWDLQFEYLRAEGAERGVKSLMLRWVLHRLRLWDHRSAAGVDHFAADSAFAARRIAKAWRREAEVIHAPVDTDFFTPGERARGEDYVVVSRLVGYKRMDLIVEAFRSLPGRRLVVIGEGPERARLAAMAGPNVQFTGHLSRDELRERLRTARAFLFAAIEDYGIAPIEAMACGTPVIALRRGGVAETVAGLESATPTGVFFEEQSASAMAAAVTAFESAAGQISATACRQRAERYSAGRFRERFSEFVTGHYARWQQAKTPASG